MQAGDFKDKEDFYRSDPPPVMPRDDDFNTSKQALKNRKKAIQPQRLGERKALNKLKDQWERDDRDPDYK